MSEQPTHDMGGNEAGEVEFGDHDLSPWQKEVFAMRQVLGSPDRQLIRVDELRRAIEDLPEEQYAMAYFDRWVRAVRTLVVEKGVLGDFGTTKPDDVAVSVHDSTADVRYLVLPLRPEGTDGLNEAELASLLTRDALVGVTLPKAG